MSERKPPRPLSWWRQILVSLATMGLPGPAAREMRRQMENPPLPYREPLDRTGKVGMWITIIVLYLAVGGVIAFVAIRLLT